MMMTIEAIATVNQIEAAVNKKVVKILTKSRALNGELSVVPSVLTLGTDTILNTFYQKVFRIIWEVEETSKGRVFIPYNIGEDIPNVSERILAPGPLTCEACRIRRPRKYWYVIENLLDHSQYTVGRTCAAEMVSPETALVDELKRQGLIAGSTGFNGGNGGGIVPVKTFDFVPALQAQIGASGVAALKQRAFSSLSKYDKNRTAWHTLRVLFRGGRASKKALEYAVEIYGRLGLMPQQYAQNPIHVGFVGKTVKVHIVDVSYFTEHTCWCKDKYGSIYTCRTYGEPLKRGDVITGIVEKHTVYNGVKQNRLAKVRRVTV